MVNCWPPQRPLRGDGLQTSSETRIVNVVATGRFPCELDIEKLHKTLDLKEKIYEPEIYPALFVKVGKERYHVAL